MRIISRRNRPGRITIGHGWIHVIWKRNVKCPECGVTGVLDQFFMIPFMKPRFPAISG